MKKNKENKKWMYLLIGLLLIVALVILWALRAQKKQVGSVDVGGDFLQKTTESKSGKDVVNEGDIAGKVDELKEILINKGTTKTSGCGCY